MQLKNRTSKMDFSSSCLLHANVLFYSPGVPLLHICYLILSEFSKSQQKSICSKTIIKRKVIEEGDLGGGTGRF